MVAVVAKSKKTKLLGFNADDDLKAEITRRSFARHEGNVAAYLRSLAQHDIEAAEAQPSKYDPAIIEKLATLYAGYFAPTFARQLAEHSVDQPRFLHAILTQLSECFACGAAPHEIAIIPIWEARPAVTPLLPAPRTVAPADGLAVAEQPSAYQPAPKA